MCVCVCQAEWRYLLSGGMPAENLDNPADDWLSDRAWQDVLGLSALENFSTLAKTFGRNKKGFKNIFDSLQPHRRVMFDSLGSNKVQILCDRTEVEFFRPTFAHRYLNSINGKNIFAFF